MSKTKISRTRRAQTQIHSGSVLAGIFLGVGAVLSFEYLKTQGILRARSRAARPSRARYNVPRAPYVPRPSIEQMARARARATTARPILII